MNKFFLQFALLLAAMSTYSFTDNKNGDLFGTRSFLQSKGQYDNLYITKDEIKYGFEHGEERIYFTDKGVVYIQIKTPFITQGQKDALRSKKDALIKPNEIYKVNATWKNANENIQIVEAEKQTNYFTFGESKERISSFKKIIYKNVYDKIDIEYVIPENKEHGIKYNVILHPGADASKIQIEYSGDVKDMTVNELGEVVINTPMNPIVEHKPYTFNASKNEVSCIYVLKNNVIGFQFPNNFVINQDITIDPWVTTLTSLTTNQYGYDVDHDNFGNLFVYGGTANFKTAKYNAAGVLQWTFLGSITSPVWSTGSLAGNFVVKRTTGQSFQGQGIDGGGTRIIRLDANGVYDNLVSTQVINWLECWDLAYHCTTGNVYGLGGAVPSNLSAGILDQVTGNIVPMNFFPTAGNGQDVVCHTIDNTGEIYLLYASVSALPLNNRIAKINAAFTSSVLLFPTTFNSMNEAGNKIYVGGNNTSNGFNALASNNNFIFYYDGFNLSAYNKTTGAILGSTTISGYIVKRQGGIAVDDCNNVYIGGNNGDILSYKFNGSSFSALPSINLNVTTTNKYVCDIRFEKPTNLLYVSGSGFCGTFNAINSSTCALVPDCNYSIPPQNAVICLGAVTTVSIGNPNNLTNPSYSIQPAGQTQSSPIFTVSPSVTTSYTLYITGLNSSSMPTTNTTVATVSVMPVPSSNPILTNGTCANPVTSSVNLNITFNPSGNPNYTTLWSPMPSTVVTANSPTAAGLVPGPNSVTITTEHGCKTVVNFTVPPIPLPANFIVFSNDYTVTCLNPNVLLTTSVTNGVPLTFVWMPSCTGTTTGASMNFTQACTGQVVGTSATGCMFAQTYTVYQNFASPTIAVTPTVVNITCTTTPLTFTGTSNMGPNVTTNWFQVAGTNTIYVGAASGTINIFQPGQPGVYWFESVNNLTGCKSTKSVEVTASVGVPIFTVTSPNNFTVGCSTKSISSMQVSTVVTSPTLNVSCYYSFVPPPGTLVPTYSPQPNVVTTGTPGTWVVYVRDQTNNCVSSQSITIIQNITPPNIDFIQPLSILSCRQPSMVLSGISSNSNTTITWTVPAPPSSSVFPAPNVTVTILPSVSNSSANITTIGTYTVGAVDNNNLCTANKTIQINQDIRIPRFTITAQTNSAITCANLDVLLIPVVSNTLAAALVPTFMWYPPIGPGVPGSLYNTISAGSHTAISTSAINGCTDIATYNVAINQTPPALEIANEFTLDCNVNPTVSIFPTITGTTTGFTYSWTVPFGALTSNLTKSVITSNMPGSYIVIVTNSLTGCIAQGIYQVVEGGIKADFEAVPDYGFAPLPVTFNNLSSTSTGASNIISTWGYGNGAVTQTVLNTVPVSTTYTAAGTYSVLLTVQKGSCIDSKVRVVIVELASKLEIPNVFTPNGDKSNDIFKLRATNLSEIDIIIFDRWGTKVYEVHSETGNFAWDGKNEIGKECAEGTYFYIIKAQGKDNQEYDLRGNVSLFR